MKKTLCALTMAILAASLLLCPQLQAQNKLDIHKSNTVTTTATVEAVEVAERSVRMKTALGNSIVLHASKEVNNLDQVKVGDSVVVEYFESLAVRMAAPGEVKAESIEVGVGAEPGDAPAGAVGHQLTITAKILAIDKQDETVTLEGPDGTVVTVEVMQPENLEKVKVGDTIKMTYTEAIAMSIRKIGK